jgi:hypothetical protein
MRKEDNMLRAIHVLIAAIVLISAARAGDEDFKLGPDSMRHEGVPRGTVTKDVWRSKIFANTTRDYWVYVPAQYDGSKPACIMVFQDGGAYVGESGDFRVPTVFDNLIHKHEMPVTLGIFVNPGQPNNRSFEYDTLSDQCCCPACRCGRWLAPPSGSCRAGRNHPLTAGISQKRDRRVTMDVPEDLATIYSGVNR